MHAVPASTTDGNGCGLSMLEGRRGNVMIYGSFNFSRFNQQLIPKVHLLLYTSIINVLLMLSIKT